MKLECEFATKSWELPKPFRAETHGQYQFKHPQGAVIHYTAGATNPTSHIDVARSELTKKHGHDFYTYWTIGIKGEILQTAPVDQWGHHCGRSKWTDRFTGFTYQGCNRQMIGIEIVNPGHLTKDDLGTYRSWFGKAYTKDQVRFVDDVNENQLPGIYVPYTEEQEASLIKLMLWFKRNAPEIFSFGGVCGHDEIAYPAGRKQDPGGALSMTMPEFRLLLKNKYEQGLVE
jgi:N-acetyl-anhydromuramyl-L-alanine amidase AmpD